MNPISKRFTPEAAKALRAHIAEVGGSEVFLVGRLNDAGVVQEVEVFARGNDEQAPALLQVARPGEVVIHNHPSGVLKPSAADTEVASILGNDGVGFFIVNNQVSQVFVAVEPFRQTEVQPIDVARLMAFMGERGPVARRLEHYEHRPQQMEMIQAVSEAINGNKVALIEAGTGTGKTLAYLLPAITFALNNEERTVISTNTINLQEQLVNKDIPFLQSVSNKPFKAALVKGRTNYACKRKLSEARGDLNLFAEEQERSELDAILRWARTTKDGSKSDLSFVPRESVWEKIQSESDTSLKSKCPFYDECFFYQARRAAASADILVANHHLLFSDLAVRAARGASENAVLPAYDRIILDEAHNIEEVATNYFGARITYVGILRILNKLFRRKGGEEKGLLPFLAGKLTKMGRGIPHETFIQAQTFIQEEGIAEVESVKSRLTEVMELIFHTVRRLNESEFGETKLRLTPRMVKEATWQNTVVAEADRLLRQMRRFTARMSQLLTELEALEKQLQSPHGALAVDLQAQVGRLDAAANTVEHVLLKHDEDTVRWLEVREGYQGMKIVRLCASPLEVAPILQEAVYKKFESIVMTSATLTVAGSFDYLKGRLGLNDLPQGKLLERAFPAPFDYQRQALVGIPNDIPGPNEKHFAEILRADPISRCAASGPGLPRAHSPSASRKPG